MMIEQKNFLAAASKEEIAEVFKASGEASFRAGQAYDWVVKKWTVDPAAMTNLSAKCKQILAEAFECATVKVVQKFSADDGSAKFLLELKDQEKIECAMIPAEDGRTTFCLSSQVGCPVSCAFCSSGENGLVRNLTSGEIIEQYFLLCRDLGSAPDNVVMMGIGEPLLNFDNLVEALNVITNPDGVALAQRRITISTSGWTPGIRALTKIGKQWNLAVSLHAPDDKTRALLIATRFRRDIHEILEACQEHREVTGRLLTIEYVLLAGINDSPEQARKFARLAADAHAKVNLIPYNKARGAFERPSRDAVKRFENALKTLHVPVTVRVEKGSSATAACGQLRASTLKNTAKKVLPVLAVLLSGAVMMLAAGCCCFSRGSSELTEQQTALMKAVNSPDRDLTALNRELKETSPNFTEPLLGRSPLMTAILNADLERMDALIAGGADLELTDHSGNRAIHYAAGQMDASIMEHLIKAHADINAKGNLGKTAVMEAARVGNLEVVKLLCNSKADLSAVSKQKRTAVMYAAMAPLGATPIIDTLIAHGAELTAFSDVAETPLLLAIDYHNTETAMYLLQQVDKFEGNREIHFAGASMEITTFNRYNEVTVIGLLAMKHAIAANDTRIVKALLARKLPLNTSINRVYRGMELANMEGFHELLARNGLIADGKTPLFWASENNNVPIMKMLIEAGADPLMIDNTGNTASEYAMTRDAVEYIVGITEIAEKKEEAEREKRIRKGFI